MTDISDSSAIDRDGNRSIVATVTGLATSDGAGVRLTRYIGTPTLDMVDPFLLLDVFESDNPDDYIAGFPSHPHRGFETVTYLLAGRVRHEDSKGHVGILRPGGVQWMTAGRGIVHSEMPEQENGLLKGFQLWINLPAAHKMSAPSYQEYEPEELPVESSEDGVEVRVIAGETSSGTSGLVKNHLTDPVYMDISLVKGGEFVQPIADTHSAFLYVDRGTVSVVGAETGEQQIVDSGQLAVLGEGRQVELRSEKADARLLLVAAMPLNEPVSRGGPFVMNTEQEVIQAFKDYQEGKF
ncbi:pirin family protein [Pseudomonadota bacterium]